MIEAHGEIRKIFPLFLVEITRESSSRLCQNCPYYPGYRTIVKSA